MEKICAKSQGLAHFLEHMLFMGSEKYPGPVLAEIWQVELDERKKDIDSTENVIVLLVTFWILCTSLSLFINPSFNRLEDLLKKVP